MLVQDLMEKFAKLSEKEESKRSPDIENAGHEGSYSIDREDMRHPDEDGHVRMAQGWHNEAKNSCITDNLIR